LFVNLGKPFAALEVSLTFAPSRFDRYFDALVDGTPATEAGLDRVEFAGLRLFIGKAGCTNCHNGPLFTNQEFHNTGVPARLGLPPDNGRRAGADAVLRDEFNCRSRWSDDQSVCDELEYLITGDAALDRAFKVPSLRSVALRPPYMHAGQFDTLTDVIAHYNQAPEAPTGRTELKALHLSRMERRQLEAFLGALTGVTQQ
jgi:cytochrome c peroxidase